jgi:ABC-type protease/lipase transport system fused ATPase/permease subunit
MDKMLVLEAGRVQQYGSVAEVMLAMQQPPHKAAGGQVVSLARTGASQSTANQTAALREEKAS